MIPTAAPRRSGGTLSDAIAVSRPHKGPANDPASARMATSATMFVAVAQSAVANHKPMAQARSAERRSNRSRKPAEMKPPMAAAIE